MQKILLLLVVLLVALSCNNQNKTDKGGFYISGSLDNANSITIYLEELTTQDLLTIDSVQTDQQGNFSFTQSVSDAGFYIIRNDHLNFLTLLVEPGESITIEGDATDLAGSTRIEGSVGSEKLIYLNRTLAKNFHKVDSLAHIFQQSRFDPDFQDQRKELDMAYTRIYNAQQQFVMDFIHDNPRSLASIIALYKYFGNQLLLNENEHFEYFEKLSHSLSEIYPNNKHVMDLNRRVNEYRRNEHQRQLTEANLAIGTMAPEIILPDTSGNAVALSSLRGKFVLIDFWAAWCPPCRKINPRLKDIYEKYNSKGFEIYGISLDRTREQWVSGIEEDQIPWTQVSDLRFWSSPVVSLYNVEGIPYSVLIDEQGNIVAKGIDLARLEDLLDEMLR